VACHDVVVTGGRGRGASIARDTSTRRAQQPWPLIGREHELALTVETLVGGRGVVLAGRAGVGKTRLAREASARLTVGQDDGRGSHVEWVTVTAGSVPLNPFAHLLERLPAPARGPLLSSPVALVRRALDDRAQGRPVVLVVDDAHLLDEPSASLVLHLARSASVTVLATVRTNHPCPAPVVALWKDDDAVRLDLQPLTRSETAALLEAVLGGPATESTVDRLVAATCGNTLFLRELVVDGLANGAFQFTGGWWRWTGQLRVPERLSEVVGAHLGRLEPDQREAAELVALAEPVPLADLVELVPPGTVEQLVERGVLDTSSEEGVLTVRLGHPLIGEVLLAHLGAPRRLRLLGKLADGLTTTGSLRDLLRRVSWLVELEREVAVAELLAAAHQCTMVAPDLARRLAARAAAAGEPAAPAVVLAQTDMVAGRSARAEETLAAFAHPTLDQRGVSIVVMRANNLAFGLRRPEDALALLDELGVPSTGPTSVGCTGDPPSGRTRQEWLDGQRVPMLLLAGRLDELTRLAEHLLHAPTATAEDRMRARFGLVPALALAGRIDEAIDTAQAGMLVAHEVRDELPHTVGQLGTGLMLALQWSGRFDQADALARMAYEHGVADDVALQRGVAALHLGLGAVWRGLLEEADRWLAAAVADLLPADLGFLPSAVDNWRATQALLGRPARIPEVGDRLPLYETERLRLEGVVAAAGGVLEEARRCSRAAAARAEAIGAGTYALFAWVDVARHGDAPGAAAAIDRLPAMPDGPLAAGLAAAVAALAGGAPDVIADHARRLEALGLQLHAAEWAAAAAWAHQRAGSSRRARAEQHRALELARRCGNPRTPLLRRLAELEHPALTAREREVAELAGAGRSNAEVARDLGVSVRTVETHLQRVYTKLGINSRRDLADLFQLG
jgi:DNA-binding CsgD family transcriptional regulator